MGRYCAMRKAFATIVAVMALSAVVFPFALIAVVGECNK